MPIVNNTIGYIEILLRVEILCSVFLSLIITIREQEETFGVDGYVYGIDYGNNFMNVYLSPKSSSCIC